MGKRSTKLWKARKKVIGRSPTWLRTVQIAKGGHHREPGTFGPASEAVWIDPATGLPLAEG